jgi:hypothetical protein
MTGAAALIGAAPIAGPVEAAGVPVGPPALLERDRRSTRSATRCRRQAVAKDPRFPSRHHAGKRKRHK